MITIYLAISNPETLVKDATSHAPSAHGTSISRQV
jgi:hypothetical protein